MVVGALVVGAPVVGALVVGALVVVVGGGAAERKPAWRAAIAGLAVLSARAAPKCCSPSEVLAPPLSSRRSYQYQPALQG